MRYGGQNGPLAPTPQEDSVSPEQFVCISRMVSPRNTLNSFSVSLLVSILGLEWGSQPCTGLPLDLGARQAPYSLFTVGSSNPWMSLCRSFLFPRLGGSSGFIYFLLQCIAKLVYRTVKARRWSMSQGDVQQRYCCHKFLSCTFAHSWFSLEDFSFQNVRQIILECTLVSVNIYDCRHTNM